MPYSPNTLTAQVQAATGRATYGTLFTGTPTSSGGTEISGVTRLAITWNAPTGTGPVSQTANAQQFSVAQGVTVGGYGAMTAQTGGEMAFGAALPSLTFPAPGTYTVTPTAQTSANS